jgi:hypothetical protein
MSYIYNHYLEKHDGSKDEALQSLIITPVTREVSRAYLHVSDSINSNLRGMFPRRISSSLMSFVDDPANYMPLLAPLMPGANLTDNDKTRRMDANSRAAMLQKLVVQIVKDFTDVQPLVMIFDDAQVVLHSRNSGVLSLLFFFCLC